MATTHLQGAPPRGAPAAAPDRGDDSSPPASSRLARLWQLPLFLVSLGLFGYAGYRLIDPQAPATVDERLAAADKLLNGDRPDAAAEVLRGLMAESDKTVAPPQRARAQLYLARAIEQVQRARKLDLPDNHKRIVDYSIAAAKAGLKLDADACRRLGESYEALGKPAEAVDAYRKAVLAADPDKASALQRKVIDVLVAQNDAAGAEAELRWYLADRRVTAAERAWALGEQSRLLVDRGLFGQATTLVTEAIAGEPDPVLCGQLNYRLGYCHWKLGEDAEAERYLRVARDQLTVSHPQDAEAALLLGRLCQKAGRHPEAVSFFNAVVNSHPESAAAPAARVGRGVSRVEAGEDDAGLEDLSKGVAEVSARPAKARLKPDALAGLAAAGRTLADRGNFRGALELMSLEQTLEPTPPAEFFGRLSRVYERRADQIDKTLGPMPEGPARMKRWQEWRDALAKAGDAAVAHSNRLTVLDDRGYGEALWRGIDLYDRAGALPQAVAALELFVAERPDDPLTPDALLRAGKAYHASGQFDRAVAAFQRNQFRYPQSLAAQKSGVPLARAYVAKGPAFYGKAEAALNETLRSRLLTPDAEEFREALFELAQLYYRTNRYEESIARLGELTDRYPTDERKGQLLFLMADGHRKSAGLLQAEARSTPAVAPATAPATAPSSAPTDAQQVASRAERAAAARRRLGEARRLYDGVVDYYRPAAPKGELDRLYLKLAHFYRADCAYDLGAYDEAIRLYDAAALRYQDDPSALAGYVQIVNAYAALGKPAEAKAANERAKWLLGRMPPEAFREAQQAMPQQSWDDWVRWSKTAGLW